MKALERRWVEILDAKSIVGILHYSDSFTEQFLNKLDDQILEAAETMTASELAEVKISPLVTFYRFKQKFICSRFFPKKARRDRDLFQF